MGSVSVVKNAVIDKASTAVIAVKTTDKLLQGRGLQAIAFALIYGQLVGALIAGLFLTLEALSGACGANQDVFASNVLGGSAARAGFSGLRGHGRTCWGMRWKTLLLDAGHCKVAGRAGQVWRGRAALSSGIGQKGLRLAGLAFPVGEHTHQVAVRAVAADVVPAHIIALRVERHG